ncbi:MAG: hypothetical protein H7839_20405 [Magnetococcus sp. YQC-5]
MSEYQYYEFLAVDRSLTKQEMGYLRELSSRARITPTSFVNHYNYGDFKGNPDHLMECCFDFYFYLANWGSRQFQIRIPELLMDASVVEQYCPGGNAQMRKVKGHLILEFFRDEDGGEDWDDDGQGWMASLSPVRTSLMRGDLRLLYLGWLLAAQEGVLDDDVPEPPLPSGLGKMDGPLLSFVEFMGIDRGLVQAAASGNESVVPQAMSQKELVAGIRALPEEEKVGYLLRVVAGEDAHVGLELLLRLEADSGKGAASIRKGKKASRKSDHRTVGELLAMAEEITQERQRREKERKAAERARQEQERAAAHEKYLDKITGRETAMWQEVDGLIVSRFPKQYDQAVALLIDLRDLAMRSGQMADFGMRVSAIRQDHARKSSFIERLDKARLTGQ